MIPSNDVINNANQHAPDSRRRAGRDFLERLATIGPSPQAIEISAEIVEGRPQVEGPSKAIWGYQVFPTVGDHDRACVGTFQEQLQEAKLVPRSPRLPKAFPVDKVIGLLRTLTEKPALARALLKALQKANEA